jgi:hypothetical protein
LVDTHCLDYALITLPHYLELATDLHQSLFDVGVQTLQDKFGRRLLNFDVGHTTYHGQIGRTDILLQDGLQFLVSVVFQHVFQGLGVLTLGNGTIGFEDVLDGHVHVGLEGKFNEFVLNYETITASFYRLRLQVILRLVALVRYS